MADYPCKTCTRVKDPEECGNKDCKDWLYWFLERWKGFNRFYKKHKKKSRSEENG